MSIQNMNDLYTYLHNLENMVDCLMGFLFYKEETCSVFFVKLIVSFDSFVSEDVLLLWCITKFLSIYNGELYQLHFI